MPECQHGAPRPDRARGTPTVPTYQYACTECGHAFEQFQSFSDDALTECPQCSGRLRKLFNAVGVVFKGSGFYRNDSRATTSSPSSTTTTSTSEGSSGSSSTSGSGSGSGDSGSGSGASTKPATTTAG
ncbi:FmdB family transcriptional regulator [Nocardioides euryhalodurans]|uniref:FmdB family transcriptional regulator n=1 Tax=Nocardioides euryhalodurans TaxID=2518370 RepID=A0A4P7GKQ1_9ACTN|nr:FmdB family transcriptional regulator [Nocardioides euryhalodurans]